MDSGPHLNEEHACIVALQRKYLRMHSTTFVPALFSCERFLISVMNI